MTLATTETTQDQLRAAERVATMFAAGIASAPGNDRDDALDLVAVDYRRRLARAYLSPTHRHRDLEVVINGLERAIEKLALNPQSYSGVGGFWDDQIREWARRCELRPHYFPALAVAASTRSRDGGIHALLEPLRGGGPLLRIELGATDDGWAVFDVTPCKSQEEFEAAVAAVPAPKSGE